MLHRASHLSDWGGAVWQRLLAHQASGLIGDFGVSVQGPGELSLALKHPEFRYIQMPFNLMDWRWSTVVPNILAAKAARSLKVHVRSTLLQGLLPSADVEHWRKANVEAPESIRQWLLQQVELFQRESIIDLCLAYVAAQPWVDGVAIGMENMAQLADNIHLFGKSALTEMQAYSIQQGRPKLSEATLNPAHWRQQP
jgi:aryl-alcohol dehydrogenase-like predicted oxidoreductase